MTPRLGRRVRALLVSLCVSVAAAFGGAPAAQAYTVYPGDNIRIQFSDGAVYICTLNSVAQRDGAMWGVTAGHCLIPRHGTVPVRILASDGRTVLAANLNGHGVKSENGGSAWWFSDTGWFQFDPHVSHGGALRGGNITDRALGSDSQLTAATRAIHPKRPIAGRAPISWVRVGQIVCKDGGTTSRSCGPVIRVNYNTGEIYTLMLTVGGDSGSPLYLLTPRSKGPLLDIADAALPLPGGLS